MTEEKSKVKKDFRKPLAELNFKSKYICGLDVARTGKDETAIVILEQLPFDTNIFLVYIDTFHSPDLTYVIAKVKYLDDIFHFKKIIVDETGLGAGVSDSLKQQLPGRVEGVWYTQKSKVEMFNNLKLLMTRHSGKLYIPDYAENNDPIIRKMFYQFLSITQEFKEGRLLPKIAHEEREHDDIVNALALAATYFKIRDNKKRYPLAGGKF